MYALVHENRVLFAREWSKVYFEYRLFENFGVTVDLPINKVDKTPIDLINDLRILPVKFINAQVFNSKIEQPAGPFYEISNNEVIGRWEAVGKPIDQVKSELKNHVANLRWIREQEGLALPNGAVIKTDRESQAIVNGALNFVQLNPAAVIDWKGENGWIQLTKNEIEQIAYLVGTLVEKAFSKEKYWHEVIDAATTLQELDNIQFDFSDIGI